MTDAVDWDASEKRMAKMLQDTLERKSGGCLPSTKAVAEEIAAQICIVSRSVGSVMDEKLKAVAKNFDITREWVDSTTDLLTIMRERLLGIGKKLEELDERVNMLEARDVIKS